MPITFPTEEYRLVQWRLNNSVANATNVSSYYTVPAGKIWTIIAFGYAPSVAETKTVSMVKVDGAGNEFAIMNPVSLALQPAKATFLDPGSFMDLLPGETIKVYRDTATAGSTMGVVFEFIEWDIPLYDYVEPQAAARIKRYGTSLADRLAGGSGGGAPGAMGGGRPAGFRGGGSRVK